jgi:peptide/nickel transport system ATP-binding protein/oligopeptide transport system ATP-binding protein
MQIIFQDPYSSLDPRITVGESVAEGLVIHGIGNRAERLDRVREALLKVGLHPGHMQRFPHQFSGGQRQRIGIARALVMEPRLIICDEPVSALDVSVQSQVLNLLRSLQKEFSLTYIFVAHNLSVVEHISHRVAVMYLGKVVELADRDTLFRDPKHPYTRALISAIPVPDPTIQRKRIILKGDVPSPVNPPSGCRFHPRCWMAQEICKTDEPVFEQKASGHWSACHFAEDVATSFPDDNNG